MRKGLLAGVVSSMVLGGLAADAFGQAQADTDAVQSGDWSNPATWGPFGEPTNRATGSPNLAATNAIINGGYTVTITQPGETALRVDLGTGAAGNSGNLSMTGGDLTVSNPENIAGGLPSIRIGQTTGTNGTFTMNGGTVTIGGGANTGFAIGDLLIGDVGTGAMTMTGGSVTADDEVFLGLGPGSSGTLDMRGGTLRAVGRNLLVGFGANSTGDLTLRDNGTINIGGIVFTSFNGTATSTVNHSAGTLNAGGVLLGQGGNSTWNMTGGALNQTGTGGPSGQNFVVGRDDTPTTSAQFNHSGGAITVAKNMFLGDFDDSTGTYTISGGTLSIAGNLNVGAAIASNAAANRVEPNGSNGAQGQALRATGTFVVDGRDGTINVTGGLLANPADKSPARNAAGQQNSGTLRFIFESGGVSPINAGGIADLDGAVIDIQDPTGFLATSGPVTLINAAGGFGNFYTITPTEQAGTGEGFTLSAEDRPLYVLSVVPNGAGERLQVSLIPEPASAAVLALGAAGLLARRRRR